MRPVKLIFISICLGIFLSSISGCETIVYWENLPRLTFPRVVRIEGDNEAIARAVKITQRLVDAKPLPASTIFVMTTTYYRTNIYKMAPSSDYRARAFRCLVKGEQQQNTLPPSSGCIVLPDDYLSVLTDDALAAIIAHELGHIERAHKTWQGAAEPTFIQWEADEAATDRLYRAGYCAGEAMRKYAFDIQRIYGSGATHPWQHYPKDCKPMDYKDRAIEDYALAFYNRGLTYYKKKEYDRAIQDYDQAIQLNPNYAVAFNDRGNLYLNKKDYDRAIQDYDQAIRLNPSYALAFYNRGLAYYNKKDSERALQDYDRAIQLDPRYAAAFNNRGNVYRDRKDYDRAIQDYDEAIRLNPNYALAFNNRANAYRNKRDYNRSLADYEAAARIDPKAARNKLMGYTLFYLGRVAQSAEAMERAVKAAPRDMYGILWRYITQAKEGGLETASRELSENAGKLKEPRWPAPVIDFYLGKIDEKEMFAAAENPDPKKKGEQVCEANFYAAEAKLLKGATQEAIPLLRFAEKNCPPTFYESHGASAELKRRGY